MNRPRLTLELAVCFGPAVLLLLTVGLLFAAVQAASLFSQATALHWEGPLLGIGTIACGAIGLTGMAFFARNLLLDRPAPRRPYLMLAAAILGVLSAVALLSSGACSRW